MLYWVAEWNINLTLLEKILEGMSSLYSFYEVTFLPPREIYIHVNDTWEILLWFLSHTCVIDINCQICLYILNNPLKSVILLYYMIEQYKFENDDKILLNHIWHIHII